MPRISSFYGITVSVYYEDHLPPHVHVRYAEHKAAFSIADGAAISGGLPRRADQFFHEWLSIHREEVFACWSRAKRGELPGTIDPLP